MTMRSMEQYDDAKSRMASDFRTMIADGEELMKAAASVSEESFAVARTKFEQKLKGAKAELAILSQPLLDRTRHTALAAHEYVRGNPWTAAGVAMAAGVLIGVLSARR
jgi:ElaB/YqjD/DUF883 family membrane-anchored ribosome-binding protein